MRIFHGIDRVPAALWDSAAGGELGFDRRLLAVAEAPGYAVPAYFVREHGGGVPTVATGLEFRDRARGNPLSDLLLGRLARKLSVLKPALGRALVFRTRFAYRSGILPGVGSGGTSRESLHEFLDDLEGYADEEGFTLVVMDVAGKDHQLSSVLGERGFLHTTGRPVARLQVDWTEWQGYVRTARSRSENAASTIRREVNRARRSGIRIGDWDPDRTGEAQLRALYESHHRRLNTRGLGYRQDFFSTLRAALNDRARVLVAYRDDTLVGSAFLIEGDGEAALPLVGIDYSEDRGACTYFNLGFYMPIRMAIEQGWSLLTLGTGAYEAKIRRGCHVEAVRTFWRPQGKAGRTIGGPLTAVHRRVFTRKCDPVFRADRFSTLNS